MSSIGNIINEIYASGVVRDESGAMRSIRPEAVTRERGQILRDLCLAEHAETTLEIGMAWGLATLFILDALTLNSPNPHHVVMDPLQRQLFGNAALCAVREANAEAIVEFLEEPSRAALPRLAAEKRRFDLAFIDGLHDFEGVFIDLSFVNELVKPGGMVIFDDADWDGVALACRYAESNFGYVLERGWPERRGRKELLRAYRKPLEAPPPDRRIVPFFKGFVPGEAERNRRLAEANALRRGGLVALKEGNRALARERFVRAARLDPLHWKTYLRLARSYLPRRMIHATSNPDRDLRL